MSARLSPDFVSLQLQLVERFVEIGAGSWVEGVHRLTNMQRRLGLGPPSDPSSHEVWNDLLSELDSLGSRAERTNAIVAAAASLPPAVPEHIAHRWPTVGAFSIEVSGPVARTHFYSMDEDDQSPLHPAKLDKRRGELMSVLAIVSEQHPDIERVAGGSWLYSTSAYGSLFPSAHVSGAVVRRGRTTFRGMSHWGQFVDHRGEVRTELAERFVQRVRAWAGEDPCGLFPIATLEVDSPIALFGLH